ncbi:hypothetical protein BJ508DRAFT_334981 [Ascobolus immersus RN42]|uniref:Uncharacterized protein n=1 Tax=Ascobolus immersus RN42 TaxID=1160509 RepID=A0A3N4HE32_ASCIM|nr:hypothetical protein BJ508DRAFT_334981 [Ascobolus immersus RN42]
MSSSLLTPLLPSNPALHPKHPGYAQLQVLLPLPGAVINPSLGDAFARHTVFYPAPPTMQNHDTEGDSVRLDDCIVAVDGNFQPSRVTMADILNAFGDTVSILYGPAPSSLSHATSGTPSPSTSSHSAHSSLQSPSTLSEDNGSDHILASLDLSTLIAACDLETAVFMKGTLERALEMLETLEPYRRSERVQAAMTQVDEHKAELRRVLEEIEDRVALAELKHDVGEICAGLYEGMLLALSGGVDSKTDAE